MARQEEGWPLGLQPLNARVGIAGNGDFSGSRSFNTLLTVSSSTDSSSDLDTESTGSFFHDRSVTLGSLIGVSNILELSRKSTRTRKVEVAEDKKSFKPKTWIFSLCSRDTTDSKSVNNYTPSLGHFLAVERRAAGEYRRNYSHVIYGSHNELELAQPVTEPNSLFVNGHVAPPRLNKAPVPELKGSEMKSSSTVAVVMESQFYFHAFVDNPLFESEKKNILLSCIDE